MAHNSFEPRIAALEAKIDSAKSAELADLAEKSFDTVLDADVHIDTKAGRILAAVAFLATATATVFNKVYNIPEPSEPRTVMAWGGLDVSLLSFAAFLFLVLAGAILYLAALGPSLNVPPSFKGGSNTVGSLLFFDHIGRLNGAAWASHWGWQAQPGTSGIWTGPATERDVSKLALQMEQNYLYEAFLVAEKTRAKITFMSYGSLLFKIAFVFVAPLVATLFTSDLSWGVTSLSFGGAFLFAALGFESWQRPPFKFTRRELVLFLFAVLCLVVVVTKVVP